MENQNTPRPLEGLILGVDLDGVCADFYARMKEIAEEWFELPHNSLPSEVTYGLPEWGISSPEEYLSLHRFAVTSRDLFSTTPTINGARKFLQIMSNEGARIRIITHRLFIDFFHKEAVSQTIVWLDHQGIPYSDLCFMKDKEQVGANIYIEDTPENIIKLRAKALNTICFGNSTNKEIEAPRADNWDDVYKFVHEIWGQIKP